MSNLINDFNIFLLLTKVLGIQGKIAEVSENLSSTHSVLTSAYAKLTWSDTERQVLLDWICNSDTSNLHNKASEKRHSDSGLWFLESNDFAAWANSPGFLWLCGIRAYLPVLVEVLIADTFFPPAGCGKTVLWYEEAIYS